MRTLTKLFVLLSMPALAAAAPGLSAVLQRMDAAARSFRNLSAQVTWVTFTAIVKDKSVETGSILVNKPKPHSAEFLIEFTEPSPKKISFRKRQFRIYYPKLNTVQIYDLGKQGKLIDQFLVLGFGTSGKELTDNYQVQVAGEETINGQKATKLELIPKSKSAREQVNKVELWIAESGGYPLQQKVFQPSGDYREATYSDIKLNLALQPDALSLHLPAGVTTEYPGR